MEYANLITWILVIGGWIAVHFATLSRERRKESREAVSKIIDDLRLIESLAVVFNTSDKYDFSCSVSLIWRVDRAIKTLQRVPLKTLHIPTELLTRFRQALTTNTDKSSFLAQAHDSEIVNEIHHITDELIDEIEVAKYLIFS